MALTRRERVLLIAPFGLILSGFLLIPALLGLVATISDYAPLQPAPAWVGLRNFQAILADRTFGAAVGNVVLFATLAVPLQLSLGFGLAYALRRPFLGHTVVRVTLLLPWLISPIASGVMWRFLLGSETGFLSFASRSLGLAAVPSPLSQHGLALATVGFVEVWRVAPFVAFLILSSLAGVPEERWADARLDGLSTIATMRHVALPGIGPLVLAVTMLLVGGALSTFDAIQTMTAGGPGTETSTPALYGYDKAFTFGAWPIGAASGWLIGAAVLLVGSVYVRMARRDTT